MFKTAFVVTAVLGSSPVDRPAAPAPQNTPAPQAMKTVTFESACDASGAMVQGSSRMLARRLLGRDLECPQSSGWM